MVASEGSEGIESQFDQWVLGSIGGLIILIGLIVAFGEFRNSGRPGQSGDIVYLATNADDLFQLYVVDPAADDPRPSILFQSDTDIIDFKVSPEEPYLIYTLADTNGSHDLGLYRFDTAENRLILDCEGFSCTNPNWSTDANRLIFERRNVPTPNSPPGPSRLWWLDVNTGQSVPVFSTPDWLGLGVSFSPNGEWIGYVAPLIEEIQAFNLQSGELKSFASSTGEQPGWHPDGRFYFTEVQFSGENFAVHIFESEFDEEEAGVDAVVVEETEETEEGEDTEDALDGATLINISGEDAIVNDGNIVWAPNGRQAAFTRKPSRTPSGKQMFLYNDETGEIRTMSDNNSIHYGPPQWSADGSQLTYQRFDLSVTYAIPEIWVMDANTAQEKLITEGSRPQWIP